VNKFYSILTLKTLVLSLVVVGLLIFGLYLKSYFKPHYQKVEFSTTLYPQERAIVRKMFAEDFLESKRVIGFDDVAIFIAKYDLNDDGIEDVFVQISGRYFGGSTGWDTSIYLVDKNGHWNEVFSNTTFGLFGVMNTKHNGYHDFVRIGPKKDRPLCEDYLLVYQWKNGGYNGGFIRALTKRDREIFKDEVIR